MSYPYYFNGLEFTFGNILNHNGHNKLTMIIDSYKDLFEYGFSTCNTYFDIRVSNTTPIYSRTSLNQTQNKNLKIKIDELFKEGHIKLTNSSWSSPAYTKYINGNLELVINYKKLNSIIYDEPQYVPTTKQVLNSINPSIIFSEIVIRDGFRQLELSRSTRHLTAFDTDFGTFEFVTVPNGLKNNQKYLQFVVENALNDVGAYYVSYLGRILVFSNTCDGHLERLKNVFYLLREANLKIDNDLSSFLLNDIDYLGYRINGNGISISDENYYKIVNFEQPETLQQLRSFLGLISVYKQFVDRNSYEHYNNILYNVTRNGYFYWNRNEDDAFNNLKDMFQNYQTIWFGDLDE